MGFGDGFGVGEVLVGLDWWWWEGGGGGIEDFDVGLFALMGIMGVFSSWYVVGVLLGGGYVIGF